MQLLLLPEFLAKTMPSSPPRLDMRTYVGHTFSCACGRSHSFDPGLTPVVRQLRSLALIVLLACPDDHQTVTCVKLKGLVRFKGFESLYGCRDGAVADLIAYALGTEDAETAGIELTDPQVWAMGVLADAFQAMLQAHDGPQFESLQRYALRFRLSVATIFGCFLAIEHAGFTGFLMEALKNNLTGQVYQRWNVFDGPAALTLEEYCVALEAVLEKLILAWEGGAEDSDLPPLLGAILCEGLPIEGRAATEVGASVILLGQQGCKLLENNKAPILLR